jgi:signal transduction histidine kinase
MAESIDKLMTALQQREGALMQANELIRIQAARAETLLKITALLNSRLDLQVVLQIICEEASRVMGVPAACVRLYDEESESLILAADYGLPSEFRQLVPSVPLSFYNDYRTENCEIYFNLESRVAPDYRPDTADPYIHLHLSTFIGAKMEREGQLIGFLSLFTIDQPRVFSKDEQDLLIGFAQQAALVVANARLYSALKREERSRASLLKSIITAQEEERRRIARGLNDETSQDVTAIIMRVKSARVALKNQAQDVEEHLNYIVSIANNMLETIHRFISDMRPSLLDDLGLVSAIAWFGEKNFKPKGIAFNLDASDYQIRLPAQIETELFRIVQEAITNIVRHANASVVSIHLAYNNNHITLQVEDDGQGFNPASIENQPAVKGFGLQSIQERVSILGGLFKLKSVPERGARITIKIPFTLKFGEAYG